MGLRRPVIGLTAVAIAIGYAWLPGTVDATGAAVTGIATDQACTRQASAGATLARVPVRTDDLAAMTLPRSELPAPVSRYAVDWYQYGYTDNAELSHLAFAVRSLCSINRSNGRVIGFARPFVTGNQTAATAVHLFFSSTGARNWLNAYVAATKAQAGARQITSVTVTPLAGPASDAVRMAIRMSDRSHRDVLLFRRGQVLGEVTDAWAASTTAALNLRSTAARLNSRIAGRLAAAEKRGAAPVDAVVALSAGLPRQALGTRYGALVWDWYFGGCWDPQEAAIQTGSAAMRRDYLADAGRYGQLTFCRAMYVPPGSQSAVNGVTRVFTGGTLYATAAGAHDAIGEVVRDWRARGGTTAGGTAYGPLQLFAAPSVGADAVGLRQRTGNVTAVRVLFRIGNYVAVAAMVATPFDAMIGDVRRWAQALDGRLDRLLTTRAA